MERVFHHARVRVGGRRGAFPSLAEAIDGATKPPPQPSPARGEGVRKTAQAKTYDSFDGIGACPAGHASSAGQALPYGKRAI